VKALPETKDRSWSYALLQAGTNGECATSDLAKVKPKLA